MPPRAIPLNERRHQVVAPPNRLASKKPKGGGLSLRAILTPLATAAPRKRFWRRLCPHDREHRFSRASTSGRAGASPQPVSLTTIF